jgi:hypothetical protein
MLSEARIELAEPNDETNGCSQQAVLAEMDWVHCTPFNFGDYLGA